MISKPLDIAIFPVFLAFLRQLKLVQEGLTNFDEDFFFEFTVEFSTKLGEPILGFYFQLASNS